MQVGKVPNNILKEIVLKRIKYKRNEILIRPKIGEDCCAVDFGEYACVMTTDPVTGASNEIGRLAVHISCNDIASCGVEPLGMLMTILAPPGTTENDLDGIMSQIASTADSLNIDIIGGHTEITAAVNKLVIVGTAVGRILKDKLVTTSGALEGDSIIMTKSAGIEGTAIIAHDKEQELSNKLGRPFVFEAKRFMDKISVVKEGIISGKFGVSSMHDVTEGGILGAVWEVAEASGKGAIIYKDKIPVDNITAEICRLYEINPLKLISSGSMIITCKDAENLVKILSENGIQATVIGAITPGNDRLLVEESQIVPITEPGPDELYKFY